MSFLSKIPTKFAFTLKKEYFLFATFLLYAIFGYFNHDYWRDEVHSWMISSHSISLQELWLNKKYEGHPIGWYLILFLIFKSGGTFYTVVFFHFLVSVGIVFLVVFKMPIRFYFKFLIVFCSLIGYEYLFYVRNYNIPILLFFCYFICRLESKWSFFGLTCLLIIASHFNIYATILSGSLFAELVIAYIFIDKKKIGGQLVFGISLFVLSLFLCYSSTIPPPDSGLKNNFRLSQVVENFSNFTNNILTAGDSIILQNFSNYIVPIGIPRSFFKVFTAFFIFILLFNSYRKNISVFFFILIFLSGLFILFSVTSYFTLSNRHTGILILFLISILFLSAPSSSNFKFISGFLSIILVFQIFSGLVLYYKSLNGSESNSKSISEYLSKMYPNSILIGYQDYNVTTVGFYLKKPIYSFSSNSYIHYPVWNKNADWFNDISPVKIKSKIEKLKSENPNKAIVLLFNAQLDTTGFDQKPQMEFVNKTTDDRTENMFIYEF